MSLTIDWLKKPADHAVINRWTVPRGTHALALPQPESPASFSFLVLGDTGDSESHGAHLSPQDAVAHEMSAAFRSADGTTWNAGSDPRPIPPHLILHTGDIVYMTGEKRLYDRNFRRPYTDFLTPDSTVENLVFRVPFLPVPGNHDYYDLGAWVKWLSRVPLVGEGIRALTRELFAFSLPEGGSHMGQAYMSAFVDLQADTTRDSLPYQPGIRTRLPNRYYRFTYGSVDFFALDSNTLDAPPPAGKTADEHVRRAAARRAAALEMRARELDTRLRQAQEQCDRFHASRRARLAADEAERAHLLPAAQALSDSLSALVRAVGPGSPLVQGAADTQEAPVGDPTSTTAYRAAADDVLKAARVWTDAHQRLASQEHLGPNTSSESGIERLLAEVESACDQISSALRAVEAALAATPESAGRTLLLEARDRVERDQEAMTLALQPLPADFCDQIRALSEEALDVQRELALERRRARYRPDDYDSGQLHWLDQSLSESVLHRPASWRVVYLHHPLYTTIGNHCERPDVVDVRENLLEILKGRAHLILSGHSHAFEWFRSRRLPNMGIFVTGGGGQVSLRPSILIPRRLARHRSAYESLRQAGIDECAFAGIGPPSADGDSGPLYHFLRVDISPESIDVWPIGVRRLGNDRYRRETPLPVFTARCSPGRPELSVGYLRAVRIDRERPPEFIKAAP